MRVLGLALYGPLAASTRHRLTQYEEGLGEMGIKLETHFLLSDRYLEARFTDSTFPYWNMLTSGFNRLRQLTQQKHYDCAIVYCELFPLLPTPIEKCMLKLPYIYDLDDAFFLRYQREDYGFISKLLKNKIDSLIGNAAAVTAGNEYLADYARRMNPNTIEMPTVIDEKRYIHAKRKSSHIFTVGWIGSPSTGIYLEQVFDALSILGKEAPIKFIVVGANKVSVPNVTVVNVPWSESTEIDIISSFDVGIMPLPDSGWARGKCAFKLIQYMACGIPSIASPVGANLSVLTNNCGLFASNTEEWVRALKEIRDDHDLRDSLSRNSKKRALSTYTISQNLPKLADTILSLAKF
jgi:glycosyltransferase involved in cell wall biosynthesis